MKLELKNLWVHCESQKEQRNEIKNEKKRVESREYHALELVVLFIFCSVKNKCKAKRAGKLLVPFIHVLLF